MRNRSAATPLVTGAVEAVMMSLIFAAVGMIALGAASWGLYSANNFRIPTL